MKTLNYCVSRVQMDLQDYSTHQRTRMIQYAIHFYKVIMGFKTDKSLEVTYLTLNDINCAPFPADYEYYSKVALNVGGQLITLSVNDRLALPRAMECGVEVIDPQNTVAILSGVLNPATFYDYGYYFVDHYRAGQYVGEWYSMGGGFNQMGYFREDWKRRQFVFYNVPRTEVMLEYVADKDANGGTPIELSCVDACIQYIHWQLLTYDRTISDVTQQRAQNRFNKAWSDCKDIQFAPTMDDFLDTMWSGYKSTPKR